MSWAAATRRAGSTSPASWPRRSKDCGEEAGPRERFGTEQGEGIHGSEDGGTGEGVRSCTCKVERSAMTKHMTGTRKGWLAARLELLAAEKELTRRSDEVAQRRQELPWVRIDKEYRFETDEGSASLPDLFRGRSQILVYHFMFGPDFTAGCPSCSAIADGFNGFAVHLANHDVMLWAVSRAPLAKLQAYKQRMGWSFRWASSYGSDFNADFDVVLTEEQARAGTFVYNSREPPVRSRRPPAGGRGLVRGGRQDDGVEHPAPAPLARGVGQPGLEDRP